MKRNRIILVITIGILFLGFIPAAAASGRVTKRPLDDWLDPNYDFFFWGEENWAFSDFFSPHSLLVAKMGLPWPKAGFGPWVNDLLHETSLVVGDTIIEGHITERELNDGRALITLHLDVTNAPLTVYHFFEFLDYCFGVTDEIYPILGAEGDGYIDYKVVCKIIISEPGDDLPTVWGIWDNYTLVNIIGTGYGTLTEHAVELGFAETAGATGRLRLHQIALFKPDFKVDHPKYDAAWGDLWPIETVEIFEMN